MWDIWNLYLIVHSLLSVHTCSLLHWPAGLLPIHVSTSCLVLWLGTQMLTMWATASREGSNVSKRKSNMSWKLLVYDRYDHARDRNQMHFFFTTIVGCCRRRFWWCPIGTSYVSNLNYPCYIYMPINNALQKKLTSKVTCMAFKRLGWSHSRSSISNTPRLCLDIVGFISIHMYWSGLEWNLN